MHGKVLSWCCAWKVYNWQNTSGQTLEVPSPYQFSDWTSSCLAWTDANAMILSAAPASLSKNKTDFCLLFFWSSIGRTSISAMFIGSGGIFFSLRAERILRQRFSTTGKLTAAPSDISPSYSAKVCWFIITVSVAHRFVPNFTFTTSQLDLLSGCLCWFVCSTKWFFGRSFTLALQCPFLLKRYSWEVKSFAKFIWSSRQAAVFNLLSLSLLCSCKFHIKPSVVWIKENKHSVV